MEMDQYTGQCPNCCAYTVLNPVGVTQAGAPVYRCVYCQRDAVPHSHLGLSYWLPVLEVGVSEVCPTCGIVERVATVIAESPNASPVAREIAQAVATGALIVGGFIFAGAVLKSLREAFA